MTQTFMGEAACRALIRMNDMAMTSRSFFAAGVLATALATTLDAGFAPALHAQSTGPSAATAAVINRVRVLADNGDGAKARATLDSLVSAVPRESLDEAEALYWRASLSEVANNAERDWKQIVVNVPGSQRAPEALLRLAELDMIRNNTLIARQHVQRLLTDYPDTPERPHGLLLLAQTYFADKDAPRACGVITTVRREAPLSAVEVRLQADELQQQCRGVREVAMGEKPDATPVGATPVGATPVGATPVGATPVGATPVPPVAAAATSTSIPPRGATEPAPRTAERPTERAAEPATERTAEPETTKGKFTVQVAAYDTRAQADALAKKLTARKFQVHVAGTKKPFRVQIGRYATRADATAALERIKKSGQKGFVAAVGTP